MNIKLHYDVPGDDFTRAGEASGAVKRTLKQLGFPSDLIRRVSIAMYEAEINIDVYKRQMLYFIQIRGMRPHIFDAAGNRGKQKNEWPAIRPYEKRAADRMGKAEPVCSA